MNLSTLVGLVLAGVVFFWTTMTSTDNASVFLDAHAAVIVIAGTFAACLTSFSISRMMNLSKVFFKKALGKKDKTSLVVNEIVDLAKGYRQDSGYLKSRAHTLNHVFLKEAVELYNAGGLEAHEYDEILVKRVRNNYKLLEEDAENFKTMSKFPPAFGLLGAVIGMVSMMQNMGGPESLGKVGPSLAVALVATLYGIALANFFFLPLAENLTSINKKELLVNQMICDAMKLIRAKKHPVMVAETCISYLSAAEKKASKTLKMAA